MGGSLKIIEIEDDKSDRLALIHRVPGDTMGNPASDSTFLHECGHALTALALTNREVTILLGDGRKGVRWRKGRLQVVIGWFTGFVGFARYDREQIAPHRILWITLAGPLVSLLLCILFGGIAFIWSEPQWLVSVVRTLAYATFAQFLFTILPLRYPRWFLAYGGKTSDGWRILEILRPQAPVT